jgi:outer membrane protein assembly factor BamD
MTKRSSLLSLSLALAVVLSGCAGKVEPPKVAIDTPEKMYQQAQHALDLGNILKATTLLEAMESRYPFGPQATQVQLDLISAYYRQANYEQALASIDRFMRLNPTHADIDYVLYMRGLSNMQSDQNMFHEMLDIDRSDRDPQYSIQAFKDFKQLITAMPNSHYAADARQRMVALKNRLARHQLTVAKYYLEREIYVAAINRAKQILSSFNNTQYTQGALKVMIASYQALNQHELAERTKQVLSLNYPAKPLK